jgi:hypothetical protein
MSVAINGTVTLDESSGLQTGGVAVAGEDNNDSDVALAALPLSFSNRLFGAPAAGLGLSATFASAVGAAKSADNYITATEAGTIVSLGFAKADGTALPVFGGVTPGVASGMSTITGGAISLFADPVLGSRMVLGVDAAGDVACALFMEPNAGLTSAKVWMVQLEALSNPVANNFDDPLTMAGLGVAAGVSTEFNFNALPSGQNLFGTVGTTASGLVVIGKTPVLNADGTFTNASNTINTSQGGGPTTIGVNNQMFDAGDGAYFTFVNNPVANFLAGAPGGLDQGEADDADNIQYTGGTVEGNGAFVRIAQIQGNSLATMDIKCFDMAGAPQGSAFATTGLGTGPAAAITAVRVFNAAGQKIEDSALPGGQNPAVTITFTNGVARVAGVGAGYRIEWDTTAKHDQVLITGVSGKFDIGGFGVNQATSSVAPLSGIRYEDDGPSITGTVQGAPSLTVDESLLANNDTDAFAPQFTSAFGSDGGAATPVTYALSTSGGDSGLIDTATGQAVHLSLVAGVVQGRTLVGNDLVFTVSVDTLGNVTLDQIRAVVHPTADPDESKSLAAANLVVLTATAADKDADTAAASLNIGQLLIFKDDGPSILATPNNPPTLTVDDSVLATNANGAFASQFTPTFGADGQGATPVTYALLTSGGNSGLVDTATKQAVVLSLVSGVVQGRTAVSDELVFTVSVNASGSVTLDQIRSVVHPTADPDESRTMSTANLVVLTATANDKDGDSASAPLSIGLQFVFKDDGPGIGPIANSIVDFVSGASVTKTLNGAVGADPNAAPYTIDSFTASVTVNGVLVKGVLSGNNTIVTYYADTNNDTTFGNASDTAFYRLTLQNQGGAGEYKFEVLATPPPAAINFNFDALPSGQNLFGTVGTTDSGLVVIGKTPVLNADGTFTNASNTINTSQGGGPTTIGVNNQMFDPGDGAYFTFVKNPVANFLAGAPNGLDQGEADDADNIQYTGGTLEVDTSFVKIAQIQGNSSATMDVKAFNIAGSPQGSSFANTGLGTGAAVAVTAVRVLNAAGVKVEDTALPGAQDPNVTVTFIGGVARVAGLNANYRIEWDTAAKHDQVLITGVAGKFDIGGFGTTQAAPTADQKLDFVAKATDGDGDSATAGFSIGIDGTGNFDDGVVGGVSLSSLSTLFSSKPVDALAALLA